MLNCGELSYSSTLLRQIHSIRREVGQYAPITVIRAVWRPTKAYYVAEERNAAGRASAVVSGYEAAKKNCRNKRRHAGIEQSGRTANHIRVA